MADSYKALGQYMQGKPSNEIFVRQFAYPLLASMPVILYGKTDKLLVYGPDPLIAYRYFMCISAQVFYYLLWPCKWSFAILHPGLCHELFCQLGCYDKLFP